MRLDVTKKYRYYDEHGLGSIHTIVAVTVPPVGTVGNERGLFVVETTGEDGLTYQWDSDDWQELFRPLDKADMDIDKITQLVKEYIPITKEVVEDYIASEWPNQKDHARWIKTASNEEIADWIIACAK